MTLFSLGCLYTDDPLVHMLLFTVGSGNNDSALRRLLTDDPLVHMILFPIGSSNNDLALRRLLTEPMIPLCT